VQLLEVDPGVQWPVAPVAVVQVTVARHCGLAALLQGLAGGTLAQAQPFEPVAHLPGRPLASWHGSGLHEGLPTLLHGSLGVTPAQLQAPFRSCAQVLTRPLARVHWAGAHWALSGPHGSMETCPEQAHALLVGSLAHRPCAPVAVVQ
jgi:hypothetical protein